MLYHKEESSHIIRGASLCYIISPSWHFCTPQQDVRRAPWIGGMSEAKKSRLACLALEIVCKWCSGSGNFESHWGLEVMRKRKVYARAFTRIQVELVSDLCIIGQLLF